MGNKESVDFSTTQESEPSLQGPVPGQQLHQQPPPPQPTQQAQHQQQQILQQQMHQEETRHSLPMEPAQGKCRPLESLGTSASVDFSNFLLVGFESTGTTDEEEVDVELPPPMPLVSTATCVTHNNNTSADNSTTPLADLHSQVTNFLFH